MANVEEYVMSADSEIGLGKFRSGREQFHAVLQIHPNCGDAYKGIGEALLCEGRPQDALRVAFGPLVQMQPNSGRAYLYKAIAHIELLQLDQAEEMLNKAEERDLHLFKRVEAQFLRLEGRRLAVWEDYDNARDRFRSASFCLEKNKSTVREKSFALYDLACVLVILGQSREALTTFHEIRIPGFKDVPAWIDLMGKVLQAKCNKQKSNALQHVNRNYGEEPSENHDVSTNSISWDEPDEDACSTDSSLVTHGTCGSELSWTPVRRSRPARRGAITLGGCLNRDGGELGLDIFTAANQAAMRSMTGAIHHET
eukprot:gb/GECG01008589.1/.p1 GENE.gb/GECG01008589.1/~~gb/GECG01008589.1/.p1  ORF type:complete len:312 (+),score=26.25 gb/GECG01008589.1/:1-936(+)